jgi:hypothetical protein
MFYYYHLTKFKIMKNLFYKAFLLVFTVLSLGSCKKDEVEPDPTPTPTVGEFHVDVEYVWGMNESAFSLNQALVHPMSGDTLTFTTFKHYISGVKLKKADGTYWESTDFYHLLDASNPTSLDLHFSNVPTGDYVAMQITFGVDSLRNVSGAQSGALDVANSMFWSWNSGYIMIKAEGTSPQATSGSFTYHLGGFSGANKAITVRELSFPSGEMMSISPTASPELHLLANPARLFHTYGSVSNGPIHMPGVNAGIMAQDFNSWVKVDHIHM